MSLEQQTLAEDQVAPPSPGVISMESFTRDNPDTLADPIVAEHLPELASAFNAYWQEQTEAANAEGFPIEQSPTECFRRELAFFGTTYHGVTQAARENPGNTIGMLLDLDHTAANVRDGVDERILRPSLVPLTRILSDEIGDRLQIGILSTIGQDSLTGRVEDHELVFKINRHDKPEDKKAEIPSQPEPPAVEAVTPTHSRNVQEMFEDAGIPLNPALIQSAKNGPFMTPEVRRAMREVDYEDLHTSRKQAVVDGLVQSEELQAYVFVLVDDLPDVASFKSERVQPVVVPESGLFILPDDYHQMDIIGIDKQRKAEAAATSQAAQAAGHMAIAGRASLPK